MNSIYNDAAHFRNETQTQIKFLGNLPLNKYRKGIAERYGFKSIKPFEEELDKITIWVVACETHGSSGAYDWVYKKDDAKEHFSEEIKHAIKHNTQVALFPFKIHKDTNRDDICELLEVNAYAGLIDESDTSYPYPKSVWKKIIEQYNFTGEFPVIMPDEQYKILSDFESSTKTNITNKSMHEANRDDTETLDNYIDSEADFGHYKKQLIDFGINPSIIGNIIAILNHY